MNRKPCKVQTRFCTGAYCELRAFLFSSCLILVCKILFLHSCLFLLRSTRQRLDALVRRFLIRFVLLVFKYFFASIIRFVSLYFFYECMAACLPVFALGFLYCITALMNTCVLTSYFI